MNRNRMLVLAVIALILSGGVTYLAYRLLQTRLRPPDATTQVVVAAKKLVLGARIAQDDLQLVQWPKSTPIAGSFADPSLAVGRAVLVPVEINEPITESKLAPKEAGAGLMVAIPEGMRALSIQVNAISGVTGFIQPGSRVDLIFTANPPPNVVKGAGKGTRSAKGFTVKVKGSPDDVTGSKIILENLQVLAVGQNVQRDQDGKPLPVQEVTLLVTPEEASKISLATGDGRIQLALRNPLDHEQVDSPLVMRSALYEGTSDENTAKDKESVPTVEKSSGSKKKVVVVRATKVAPPPPPLAIIPKPRVVAVELIQGIRRGTESFEEKALEEKTAEKKP